MGIGTRFSAALCVALALGSAPVGAEGTSTDRVERPGTVQQLLALTHLEPLVHVVATEGARHGLSLEGALFPGKGGSAWASAVSRIQAPDRIVPIIHGAVTELMGPEDVTAANAFFGSELGQRVVNSEVSARRKMLDKTVEAEAMGAAAMLVRADNPRMTLIEDIIDALDLVSANVSGGLNANYAFYRGLAEGGAMARRLAEQEMLAMVLNQEADIRKATEEWLRAYLTMAYAPLSDGELHAYVDFVQTRAGRRYNAAMFAGFGRVFEATSYDLGLAAARFMVAEDI
ncbi:MAG: hypothetical protein AAFY65_10740 [Pseudomonadota bacterium]